MGLKGQLVVLKNRWNIQSTRIGVILEYDNSIDDVVLVMWTDNDGIKLKYHLIDALIQVNELTSERIKERICATK